MSARFLDSELSTCFLSPSLFSFCGHIVGSMFELDVTQAMQHDTYIWQ